jgi:hypothetical protein
MVELSRDLLHYRRAGRYTGKVEQPAGVRVFAHSVAGGSGPPAGRAKEEKFMATYSGGIQPLYGVVIHDKCQTADLGTLQAYRTVVNDLLQGASGAGADELKASLGELDQAIKAKQGT